MPKQNLSITFEELQLPKYQVVKMAIVPLDKETFVYLNFNTESSALALKSSARNWNFITLELTQIGDNLTWTDKALDKMDETKIKFQVMSVLRRKEQK